MLITASYYLVHIAVLLGVALIFLVSQKSQNTNLRSAFLLLVGITLIWAVSTALEQDIRLVTGETVMAFINVCYIGICLTPIALLNLSVVILKPDLKRRLWHLAFLVVPIISIIMVYTNPLHNNFFEVFSLYSTEAVYGSYFRFHSVYSYGIILVSIMLLYVSSARNSGYFSVQSILVILGIVASLVPNILYTYGVGNLPFSISASAAAFSFTFFAIAFLKYRFIETLPVTMQQVVDLISDGYLVLDKRLNILSFNRAMQVMFPNDSSITLGKDSRIFFESNFPDTPYDDIYFLYKQVALSRSPSAMEIQSAVGTHFRMEITPVTRRPAQIGSIVMLKDVTESKLLLEASQAASRAKGSFLSQMSHEIRTPLSAIIGMINIGMNTEDITKMKYCFDRADSASKHLLSIINDVLDISKIEAEKFELSYTQFEFEPVLINISNIANVRAEEKRINFIVNIGKDVPAYIESDELRLSQAITNLLTNAMKFTPENGSVSLSIDKIDERDDVITLEVAVADSGIGISEEQQRNLFGLYNQADASITREYGGTGLGLAITKQIVELMGGSIRIESELGSGAKFIFTMKTKKLTEKPFKKLSAKVRPENIRILAVDDSVEIRDYFEYVMEALGLYCRVADSGVQALEMINTSSEKPYNIFFVDWQMPDMNGIELTKRIKEIYGDNSIIIMISITEWSVIEKEAVEAGVTHFVSKPLFPSALIDAINICVNDIAESYGTSLSAHPITRGYDFSAHTLLIVEDVEINREIIGAILEETRVSIEYAENGEIAVSKFLEAPDKYSLILMDIQMPVMDGYEATKAIRSSGESNARSIPILAMTANVFKEDIERCIASGMDDHTGKPIDTDALLGMLRKYLKDPGSGVGLFNAYDLENGIAWDDVLLTGNALVDMQHRRIFAWASALVKSCEDGSDIENLWDTIAFLENLTIRHFTDEEALQLEHDYPNYEVHRQAHERFKLTVGELVDRFKSEGPSIELSNDVNRVVAKWLIKHIKNDDMKFSEFIRNS